MNTILITFSLYHLIAGFSALGPKSWIKKFSGSVYALEIENNPSLAVALKAISLFALCTSVVFALIYFKGSAELKVYFVLVAAGLTFLRALMRYICQSDLSAGFGLKASRNRRHYFINTAIGSFYVFCALSALGSI